MTIDEVMIENRAEVQDETRVFVQRLMDADQSGVIITDVKLQAADPPEAVKDSFHDVVRAREDRERLINQALGYQADLLPRARVPPNKSSVKPRDTRKSAFCWRRARQLAS
jgi:modulator of FtsH protease HflK